MIPVTSFAGKRVAVFGLGGSGLASAQALAAGGAEVIAFDDGAASIDKARQAGIATGDLRDQDWSKLAALVLTPGVPLTHPAPHWSVDLARAAGVEVIGDVELYCRERRKLAPNSPFVAITGTNGKSTTTALIASSLESGRAASRTRRQYRHRGADAVAAARRTTPTSSSARPTRSISRLRSIRGSGFSSMSARITSTVTARWPITPR